MRFPKTAAQVARIEIEHRIVAAVADRLPIAVPRFELIGRASEDFPFVFTGYRKLPGTPWDEVDAALTPSPPARDEMACEIGEFLTALHIVGSGGSCRGRARRPIADA